MPDFGRNSNLTCNISIGNSVTSAGLWWVLLPLNKRKQESVWNQINEDQVHNIPPKHILIQTLTTLCRCFFEAIHTDASFQPFLM
jgi:hypothetical protein